MVTVEELASSALATDADISVIPYLHEDGIAFLYLMAKLQKLDGLFWHNGVPPLSEVLRRYNPSSKTSIFYGCTRKENGEDRLCGFGTGDNITALGPEPSGKMLYRVEVGELFLREIQNTDLPMKFSRLMLDDAFVRLHLGSAFGVTPTPNRAARRFMYAAGFAEIGQAPHFCSFNGQMCDAVLSVLTRERWQAGAMYGN